jgi:hypothetical protein
MKNGNIRINAFMRDLRISQQYNGDSRLSGSDAVSFEE